MLNWGYRMTYYHSADIINKKYVILTVCKGDEASVFIDECSRRFKINVVTRDKIISSV